MVNRIWQHHFGEGIVRTPNNFVKTGHAADASGVARLSGRAVHDEQLSISRCIADHVVGDVSAIVAR